jgi:hypothetical protein
MDFDFDLGLGSAMFQENKGNANHYHIVGMY